MAEQILVADLVRALLKLDVTQQLVVITNDGSPAIIVLDDEEVPIMPVPTITAETTPARHTAPIERPRSYTTSRRSYLPLRSQLVQ